MLLVAMIALTILTSAICLFLTMLLPMSASAFALRTSSIPQGRKGFKSVLAIIIGLNLGLTISIIIGLAACALLYIWYQYFNGYESYWLLLQFFIPPVTLFWFGLFLADL